MGVLQKAEIHFHQQEELSIFTETNASDDGEKLSEIALFIEFCIRLLSSLGQNEHSQRMAAVLTQGIGLSREFAAGATGGFELTKYPGVDGRKRFIATWQLRGDYGHFDLKTKGFGFLSFGYGYYAPIASLGLMRYYSTKRKDDERFLQCIGAAARFVGEIYIAGQITLTNHSKMAMMGTVMACEDYMKSLDFD